MEYLAALNPAAAAGGAAAYIGLKGAHYGVNKAYNYFINKAKDDYGASWQAQMNRNQINRLADQAIYKTRRKKPRRLKGCTYNKLHNRKKCRSKKRSSKRKRKLIKKRSSSKRKRKY